jgi:hypothetical protein
MVRKKKRSLPVAHVFDDGIASPARIRRFANATTEQQTAALSVLRKRSHDPTPVLVGWATVLLAVLAFGMPQVQTILRRVPWMNTPVPFPTPRIEVNALIGAILWGIAILVWMIIVFRALGLAIHSRNAAILLAAYEFELQRRWAAVGWQARRWRREHSSL